MENKRQLLWGASRVTQGLALMATAFRLASAQAQQAVFEVPGQSLEAFCDIQGGSVTVMGCPSKLAMNEAGECRIQGSGAGYDVYASDFIMAESSLDDIAHSRYKKDILQGIDYRGGASCDESVSLKNCDIYTRHIDAEGYDYSFMSASKEMAYPDAVIVVEINKPIVQDLVIEGRTKEEPLRQKVVRYWYDNERNEVKMETLFTLVSESAESNFLVDIQVWNNFIIILEGKTKPACPSGPTGGFTKKIQTMPGTIMSAFFLFERQKGTTLKREDIVTLIDVEEWGFSEILRMTTYLDKDLKAIFGVTTEENNMMVTGRIDVIGSSITLTPIQTKYRLNFPTGTEFSYMTVYEEILLLGCASCNDGNGWLALYNKNSFSLQLKVQGEERTQIGHSAHIGKVDLDYLRIQFSGLASKTNALTLNAVMIAIDKDGSYIFSLDSFQAEKSLLEVPYNGAEATGAYMQMFKAGDDLFFKIAGHGGIDTTKACNLTSRYEPIPRSMQRSLKQPTYESRRCVPCPFEAPYSGGFQNTECRTCQWLFINNIIAFNKIPQCVDPSFVPPEPIVEPEEPEIVEEEVETETFRFYAKYEPLEKEEFDSTPFLVFLCILLPILTVFCLATFYCKYTRSKRKAIELEERKKKQQDRQVSGISQEVLDTETGLKKKRVAFDLPEGHTDREMKDTNRPKELRLQRQQTQFAFASTVPTFGSSEDNQLETEQRETLGGSPIADKKLITEEENPPWMKEAMCEEIEVAVPASSLGNEDSKNVSESPGDQPYSESQQESSESSESSEQEESKDSKEQRPE